MDKKIKLKLIKYIPIGILLLVILFILLSIVYQKMEYISDYSMKTIDDLNSSINIPYQFGKPLDKNRISKEKWTDQNIYDTISYYSNEKEVYGFSAFPDLSDSYKLTYYSTTNNKVSVFGIMIGGKADKLLAKIKRAGYHIDDLNNQDVNFIKGKVNICFDFESDIDGHSFKKEMLTYGIVTRVTIRLESTDKFHKGYYK